MPSRDFSDILFNGFDQKFEVKVSIAGADHEARFTVSGDLREFGVPDSPSFCSFKAKFEVNSPITATAIVVTAAKLYAFCVAANSVMSIVGVVYQAYTDSVETQPGILGPEERAYATVRKIIEQERAFLGPIAQHLRDCAGRSVKDAAGKQL